MQHADIVMRQTPDRVQGNTIAFYLMQLRALQAENNMLKAALVGILKKHVNRDVVETIDNWQTALLNNDITLSLLHYELVLKNPAIETTVSLPKIALALKSMKNLIDEITSKLGLIQDSL